MVRFDETVVFMWAEDMLRRDTEGCQLGRVCWTCDCQYQLTGSYERDSLYIERAETLLTSLYERNLL